MLLNLFQNALVKPARWLTGATLTIALAACGGGGGSPGAVPNTPNNPNPGPVPATVVLTTSADTIPASGVDGTEVTLTATVKDANNSAMAGVTVSFAASSGTISNTSRISDANGVVTEKLSVKGDASLRAITVTAQAGAVKSATKTVTVTASSSIAPKLLLTASSGTLASAGGSDLAVSIRALVLDASNVVVPNALVNFSTTSGALAASSKATDAAGLAIVKLSTGDDPATRTIVVTANVAGAPPMNVNVNVVGSKLSISAPISIGVGAKTDMTVVLTDSAGKALADQPVSFSAAKNLVTTKAGTASPAKTDSTGKLVLSYTGTSAGADTVTVNAAGETASTAISAVSTNFSVSAVTALNVPLSIANTGVCNKVLVRDFDANNAPRTGTVSISASRGLLFSDAGCAAPLNGPITLAGGQAIAYVQAVSPGTSTLTATSNATASTTQGSVEFVAPLTSTAVISLQATPATVGANAVGSTTEQSVLRAVVLDNSSQGNPVKNAKVAFSIVNDTSGGVLSQPSEVLTGSDGSATVSYIAGTTATAFDGVVINARIVSAESSASATAKLTVAQRSLFISAGTGNTILTPSDSTYKVEYVVFVTDAAGNAVRDVAITGSVRPRNFRKGYLFFPLQGKTWVPNYSSVCLNEDKDSDGILGPNEDINGNGRLDPVIPLTITSSGKTDASGTATIAMTYPRDRANWLDVDFTIRGLVSGSEARYVGYTVLPGAAADYQSETAPPPGVESPYGVEVGCENTR